jgi:protein-S-isoprenylcysteine O-methyltransferase Ste14
MAIRVYYQVKVRAETGRTAAKDSGLSLVLGGVAAVVTLAFGIQYMFFPGTCRWAYPIRYPDALRWAGVALLSGGEALLALAHHHLGKNFYSLVRVREGHGLVESGPYRWIRHPIYTAYVMNYLGGGLVSANLVLTLVPVLCFGAMIALRVGDEERTMIETFGEEYESYMRRTGRFLPRFRVLSPPER